MTPQEIPEGVIGVQLTPHVAEAHIGAHKYFALLRSSNLTLDFFLNYSYGAGIDFRRQILTSKVDPRAVMVNRKCKVSKTLSA